MIDIFNYISNFFNNFPTKNLINFIFHPNSGGILLFLKVIFIIISAILIINIFFLVKTNSWLKWRYKNNWVEFLQYKVPEAADISKKWRKVEELLKSKKESNYKLAILEADSLLSQALKMDGYNGETMEEQLKKVDPADISDIEPVLRAHQIRNRIVANPEEKLSYEEAQKVVESFEKAFENLQKY